MVKLMLLAVTATILLAGCVGIPMKAREKIAGMSGYGWVHGIGSVQESLKYRKCSDMASPEACANLSKYEAIGAIIARNMVHGNIGIYLLTPKAAKVQVGDIIKYKDAHVIKTWVLGGRFAGIARRAAKTDAGCEFDGSMFGGRTVCNGWTSDAITRLW